jgi:hypothetical protein
MAVGGELLPGGATHMRVLSPVCSCGDIVRGHFSHRYPVSARTLAM